MPTLAKQLGFSAVLVGSICSILPLIGMASKVLMGALGDKFQCHKMLIIIYILITSASFFSLDFLSPINKKIEAEMLCKSNSTIQLCSEKHGEKCMTTKIKAEFKENTKINCQMECIVDDIFINDVCNIWNSSEFCDISLKESFKVDKQTTIFPSSLLRDVTKNDSSVIIFPTSMTSHLLVFHAELLAHHIEQERRCLSIPIGGIKESEESKHNLFIPYCETDKNFSCQMLCDNPILTDIGKVVDEESTISHYQFWLFLSLLTTGWIGMAAITSLGETVCFGLLGDRPSEFGKQRLFGSLGWGLMTLIGGFFVDLFSKDRTKKNYSPIFYSAAIFLSIDLFTAFRLKDTKRVQSSSIMCDIGKLLLDVRIIIYVIWCILMGMSNGIVGNFFFWYLEELSDCDDLPRIKTLEGSYVMLQSFCGEIPFFFLNAWVLNKIGHINAMSLTLFTFGTIFILYSILKNPVHFLPISFLNGITFSTMYATMASYASIIAPPGTEATMQGLIGSVYEGLGVSFGSFIAGLLMQYLEGDKVFRLYGIIALTMCVLHILIQFILGRSQKFSPVNTDTKKSVQYASPENAIKIMNSQ
ncbi:major facilitator superfamily domain-containing protein 6-A-like isoform X2 [Lycorma delicatula]